MKQTNDRIPFHRPYPLSISEKQQIQSKIYNILSSGQLTNGENVRELEDKIKEMYNVKYCIATSNATQVLRICFKFYDWLRPLHIPAFEWKSINSILPHDIIFYHDINPQTWLMDNGYRGGTVLFNHTFGNVIVPRITLQNKVIFDASHALGCKLKYIGNATVFSLAATKIITACEGGLLITNHKDLYTYALEERNISCRMSEPNAVIGLQLLPHLKEVMEFKKECFEYYSRNIDGQFQEIPIESNYNTIGFLNTENLIMPKTIEIKQYYQPLKEGFPNSDYVYSKIICLPSYYNCNYREVVKRIEEENK